MWGEDYKRGQCHCLASGGLPSTHPVSSHFTYSLYVTGALPIIALVLNPREGGSAYTLSPCRPFKQTLLKISRFFDCPNPTLIFTARSCGDLSSWSWLPGLCGLAWGWDCLLPRFPSRFLSTTRECGTSHYCLHLSVPYLVPAPPAHLRECGLFKSLVVIRPYSWIF